MAVVAGHIRQRPAQDFRAFSSAGSSFITPNPFVAGESQQSNVTGLRLRFKTFDAGDSLKQTQRVGRLRAIVASLPNLGGRRLP